MIPDTSFTPHSHQPVGSQFTVDDPQNAKANDAVTVGETGGRRCPLFQHEEANQQE